jgi:hypothetical protein
MVDNTGHCVLSTGREKPVPRHGRRLGFVGNSVGDLNCFCYFYHPIVVLIAIMKEINIAKYN